MKNTFERYLQEEFMKEYHGVKDDFEVAFDKWLEEKDGNDLIQYAEKMTATYEEHIERLMKLANDAITELEKIKRLTL